MISSVLITLTSKIDIYLPRIVSILELVVILVLIVYFYKKFKRINMYTKKAEEEKVRINNLKKYLQEYSIIDNREILEIYLWEKYLAYATVLGINKNILEILEVNLQKNVKNNQQKDIQFDFYENKYFYIDDKNQKIYINEKRRNEK